MIRKLRDQIRFFTHRERKPPPPPAAPIYPLSEIAALDALPQIPFSPYPADTMKALDAIILSKLRWLQFQLPAQKARFLVINHSPTGGFAAAIPDLLANGILFGYLLDRTVVADHRHLNYDFCYESICAHSLKDLPDKDTANGTVQLAELLEPLRDNSGNNLGEIEVIRNRREVVYYGRPQQVTPLPKIFNPAAPLTLPLAGVYVRGLILSAFLELKPEYKAHIEEKKKAIGFDKSATGPIIGVHIRHGDVVTNPELADRYFPVQTYFETVRQVADKTGIRTVFVTTDSPEVIRQLPEASAKFGIDFIYDNEEQRHNLKVAAMLRERPELSKQETLTAVKNIQLLADCDWIVSAEGGWFYNSLPMSYFRNKKLNGIMMLQPDQQHRQRHGEAACNIRCLITENDNPVQATAPGSRGDSC